MIKKSVFTGVAMTGFGSLSVLPTCGAKERDARSENLDLKVAGYKYDRISALQEGSVQVEGANVIFESSNIYALNKNAMGGAQQWEVQEIGLHPYMLAYANDAFRDYTLIPVFPLRVFRHKSMFIRSDRGINKPEDLRGKRVATPGYSQSSLTWIRGILQSEYGVKPEELQWVITSSSDKGKASRNETLIPEGVPIIQGPAGKDESELLLSGEVDAAFVAHDPKAYLESDGLIARLFTDYRQAERAYYKKTGIFPIMHAVAIRKDVVQKNPWLPVAMCKAYSEAKQMMYQNLEKMGWAMISLPWIGQELEQTRQLMGNNYWPYGIESNRKTLEALFKYSYQQGLAKRELKIEELFHPSTLEYAEKIS